MERFRLNLVISPRSDPSLHCALQALPVDIRAARLKELALAGLMGAAPRAVAPTGYAQSAPHAPAETPTAGAAPAPALADGGRVPKRPSLDIDGQLNGLDDIGLAL